MITLPIVLGLVAAVCFAEDDLASAAPDELAALPEDGPVIAPSAPVDAPVPVGPPPIEPPSESAPDAPTQGRPLSKMAWGGIALPLVNYNTTDGLGFGAGFQIFDWPRGLEHGYRDLLTFSTFWTTRGTYTSNYAQYERRGRQMIIARLAYRMWKDMLYVGNGGEDVVLRDDPRESSGNTVAGPSLLANVIFPLRRSPLQLWAQGYVRQTTVRPKPGGILERDQPFGVDGGWYFDFSAGVAVQETDRWPMPQRGVRFESSVRGGGTSVDGGVRPLVGANVELMGWYPVAGEWLVVGGRVVYDKTWGERPFYEAEWLGGQQRDENAYEQMLTGYGRSRTRGDGVFAYMLELRPKLGHVQHPFWDLSFHLSAFAEMGFLFDGDKPGPNMPSVGVAPDILWQGAIELRPFVSWGWMRDRPGDARSPESRVGISLLGPL